ncbi:ribosomal protein S5 domain 2-like protein [Leucogyrophana mollusca]|uniref:Ribosomal protein S5 domain 2-like protein n=1 Tax=Leucogyrophana mollusca TaxID=85980 RepID=A0ACB8C1U2_9AGAM|nr:ribosomal protein S5 domain 2-like protein [Leucogyrophana mollusca]
MSGEDTDSDHRRYGQELEDFVAELMLQPEHEQVASELSVLQSIYGDSAIRVWHPSPGNSPKPVTDHVILEGDGNHSETIRYEVALNLPSHEDVAIRILVSLPPSYPTSSPPQLQLLSRYIGAFGVDSSLFGSILRTFISMSGVEWSPDNVCVFDGIQNVLERCEQWFEGRLSREKANELVREDEVAHDTPKTDVTPDREPERRVDNDILVSALPEGINIIEAEPIVDRKSTFIGRACRISHPSQVPLILNSLMSDRHISRAAHPIINAWRCQVGAVLHQGRDRCYSTLIHITPLRGWLDNDDDGETAAGSRLAHLLQILEINNVLVIVTRYFGGIHLGPDRFKHINHAARNALELGGFLDQMEDAKGSGRAAGKGRKR